MESIQAFVQFLIDLFSALSAFLFGEEGGFDMSGMFGDLLSGEDDAAAEG